MTEYPNPKLSPKAFELLVKTQLDLMGGNLTDYRSSHRETISSVDGDYEFDVVCRFTAFEISFTMLAECKAYTKRVEREKVQALLAKLHSVGAQKGVLFSTSGFQSGAIKFGTAHGIALVRFTDGRSTYLAKAHRPDGELIPWEEMPDYISELACWLVNDTSEALISGIGKPDALLAALTHCSE